MKINCLLLRKLIEMQLFDCTIHMANINDARMPYECECAYKVHLKVLNELQSSKQLEITINTVKRCSQLYNIYI